MICATRWTRGHTLSARECVGELLLSSLVLSLLFTFDMVNEYDAGSSAPGQPTTQSGGVDPVEDKGRGGVVGVSGTIVFLLLLGLPAFQSHVSGAGA